MATSQRGKNWNEADSLILVDSYQFVTAEKPRPLIIISLWLIISWRNDLNAYGSACNKVP